MAVIAYLCLWDIIFGNITLAGLKGIFLMLSVVCALRRRG